MGGGTRSNVYGSRTYGSGYPGAAPGTRGVAGAGFPFFFYPVVFAGAGLGAHHYYNDEYGDAKNGSRPGGAQKVAAFTVGSETFRILADGESVEALAEVCKEVCAAGLEEDFTIEDYDGANEEPPRPEQVVQYYRASSIALSLDSYNNSAVFEEETIPDSPLNIDTAAQGALACFNTTIGEYAPLIEEGAGVSLGSPSVLALFVAVGAVSTLTGAYL